MEYISENHSKHLLICHLIFVCKYRKKLLLKVGDDIKTEIESIANHYGWQIIDQEIDQDHIHILIRYSPKWSILEIVRLIKRGHKPPGSKHRSSIGQNRYRCP